MNDKIQQTKDILSAMVAERSSKRKEFFKTYKKPEGKTTTSAFKPLPSDLIQDPRSWPEWKLEGYKVVNV